MALIGSYLLLSMLLVYASALTINNTNQRVVTAHLRDRSMALDLTHAAMEQLREDLYEFLLVDVYAVRYQSDVIATLAWLDQLNPDSAGKLDPPFSLPKNSESGVDGAGTSRQTARAVSLPTGIGMAWISSVASVDSTDPLATREITIIAEATVGGVTRRIRSVHEVNLGASDVFRHAYFTNNYGWFAARGTSRLAINGDVRANGDLDFSSDVVSPHGELAKITVNGDLYAAANPDLVNPATGQTASGTITGNPAQAASWESYWKNKPARARPALRLTKDGQPVIQGSVGTLAAGQGWDSGYTDQHTYAAQQVKPIPYLGDLALYKRMAKKHEGTGSTLRYTQGGTRYTMNSVYNGPDNLPNTADDHEPLVLVGTASKPIEINGPVVIPGDVIIRGVIKGRGTIYAGRNIHIVGNVTYTDPPTWITLERQEGGTIRKAGAPKAPMTDLGAVCDDGQYIAPGKGSCS